MLPLTSKQKTMTNDMTTNNHTFSFKFQVFIRNNRIERGGAVAMERVSRFLVLIHISNKFSIVILGKGHLGTKKALPNGRAL